MYLILQSSYTDIELALFDNAKLLEAKKIDKVNACAQLIPTIDTLLKKQNITLNNLEFIGINQGPGPFTTLRVLISTINGIAFVTNIPLVGTDGLDALLEESTKPKTIALLNAFNKDVYFATFDGQKGYDNIDVLLDKLADKNISGFNFIGNGAILYKDKILSKFPEATISEELQFSNLQIIAKNCLAKFRNKEGISHKLMPSYLKSAM